MRTRVVVHVGMHKTGTTSIQRFLGHNRPQLRAQGICYPVLYGGDSQPELALCLPNRRQEMVDRMRTSLVPPDTAPITWPDPDSAYGRLAGEIAEQAPDLVVLSSECFMEWIDPVDVARAFAAHVDADVTILVYLRNQADWIESVYRQVVRDPEIRFAGEPSDLPQWDLLDYAHTLDQWSAAFGRDRLRVRSYDTVAAAGVVRDLLSVLGVTADDGFWYPETLQDKNAALTDEQTRHLLDLNRQGVPDEVFRQELSALREAPPQPVGADLRVAGDMVAQDRFAAVNRDLERRYLDPGHRIGPVLGIRGEVAVDATPGAR